MTVVLPPTDSTLPITGKFCRALGPVSASPESLAVTPAGPRSIPSAPLPKMLLPRIEAVPSVTVMPTALLWAMTLPSPAATPPIRAVAPLKNTMPPYDPLPRAVVPSLPTPM